MSANLQIKKWMFLVQGEVFGEAVAKLLSEK